MTIIDSIQEMAENFLMETNHYPLEITLSSQAFDRLEFEIAAIGVFDFENPPKGEPYITIATAAGYVKVKRGANE